MAYIHIDVCNVARERMPPPHLSTCAIFYSNFDVLYAIHSIVSSTRVFFLKNIFVRQMRLLFLFIPLKYACDAKARVRCQRLD